MPHHSCRPPRLRLTAACVCVAGRPSPSNVLSRSIDCTQRTGEKGEWEGGDLASKHHKAKRRAQQDGSDDKFKTTNNNKKKTQPVINIHPANKTDRRICDIT